MFDEHEKALNELRGVMGQEEEGLTHAELCDFAVKAAKIVVAMVEHGALKSKNTVAVARKIIAMNDAANIVNRISK